MATGAGHFSNMNIVRPERFLQLFRQVAGHTDAVLLLYRIHRVVKTHHIFHPFTVVKRRLTVAVGTGYRQFIVRVDSARMFTVHTFGVRLCDSPDRQHPDYAAG